MEKIRIKDLEVIKDQKLARQKAYKSMLMVCAGTGCVAAGSMSLFDSFNQKLKEKGLDQQYLAVPTGCNGFCAQGPIIVVQPEGIFYQKVKTNDLDKIIDEHLEGNKPVEKLLYKDRSGKERIPAMNDIEFFSKQKLIALRNRGVINPEDIEDAIARGAYQGLGKALTEMQAFEIIKEVIKSGIRGRGGGGFPAGVKWETCYHVVEKKGEKPYIVCNADEGDPGAFMDRSIVEADPHAIIEGMAIAAKAVGAEEGYVYIRKEYPLALKRLNKALSDARERGLLGDDILKSGFKFDIHVHRGAGAFVCGESTALMASMEGRVGEPRAKYVHNVEFGYRGKPTILNNVETWANIPVIIEKGADWFASIGSGDVSENPWNGSSGTKVFSLVGDVVNSGLVEVPMGITLREIIFEIGGGIPKGRKFKAVQTGGPSGGCIPENMLDMEVDFDKLTEVGSMMGSGGMIVMDDRTCMVDIAKYFIHFLKDESCGKCTPCREGLVLLYDLLENITSGEGQDGDIEIIEQISETMELGSLCALGQTAAYPVLSTLNYFRQEYEAHVTEKKCPAGKCKHLIEFDINENCTGCILCKVNCPVEAISGEKKQLHLINQDLCIQCGICFDVCKFDAVDVV
ncbi:MAG: NAD(P)H-dependent oxidoreductase subunit E [Bacteroidetes bacterium]|nr:NAD(P)H-dependent oxidoreductase subunit E [Bacteroidota bacterium]